MKWYLELRGGAYVRADERADARANGDDLIARLKATHPEIDDLEIVDSYKIMSREEIHARDTGGAEIL